MVSSFLLGLKGVNFLVHNQIWKRFFLSRAFVTPALYPSIFQNFIQIFFYLKYRCEEKILHCCSWWCLLAIFHKRTCTPPPKFIKNKRNSFGKIWEMALTNFVFFDVWNRVLIGSGFFDRVTGSGWVWHFWYHIKLSVYFLV